MLVYVSGDGHLKSAKTGEEGKRRNDPLAFDSCTPQYFRDLLQVHMRWEESPCVTKRRETRTVLGGRGLT